MRLVVEGVRVDLELGQKAPRTRRCIETIYEERSATRIRSVRRHHAPEGALRPRAAVLICPSPRGQKAPRTRRCIET